MSTTRGRCAHSSRTSCDSGRIDVAIHVLRQSGSARSVAMTLGHFRRDRRTMLWGPVHLTLAVLPSMREAGPRPHRDRHLHVGELCRTPGAYSYAVRCRPARRGHVCHPGPAPGVTGHLGRPWVDAGGHPRRRLRRRCRRGLRVVRPGASLPGLSGRPTTPPPGSSKAVGGQARNSNSPAAHAAGSPEVAPHYDRTPARRRGRATEPGPRTRPR